MNDPIVAYVEFLGGAVRPVFEDPAGGRYVLDDGGNMVRGVWFLTPEECDQAVIVEGKREGPT
jgi:hypothetical protein